MDNTVRPYVNLQENPVVAGILSVLEETSFRNWQYMKMSLNNAKLW
jgi:hypothetical protein